MHQLFTAVGEMETNSFPDDVYYDETAREVYRKNDFEETKEGTIYGLGYDYFQSMKRSKDNIAQYIAETGEADTYENLLNRSIRTAIQLKKRNLSEDDIVCLSSYNHINSCVPLIASTFLGLKFASLDPSFTVADATHLISLVKPKVFFIVPEIVDIIREAMQRAHVNAEVVVFAEGRKDNQQITYFEEFLQESDEESSFKPVIVKDVSDTAIIFFSSGTTGLPKGICCSHQSIYHQGFLCITNGILEADAVTLSYSTSYWVSSVLYFCGSVLNGSARLICHSFDSKQIWYFIDKYKVTLTFLAPIQAYNMIAAGRPEDINTSRLSFLFTGGDILSIEKLLELRDLLPGTFVAQVYGCTEVAGGALYFNFTKTKDKLLSFYHPTSCGRPLSGYRYKVVDINTETSCGPNKKGELRINFQFPLKGYYNQDASSAFDENGWLRTGDVVYFDENFCFYIVGRIKEMLKYRSWHVPPAVLENILLTHPAVNQCIVIGIPHATDGDHPTAVVVLNEEYKEKVTGEEIKQFVNDRVNETHKLRGGVKIIDEMPLTPSGKIKKPEIKEMVLKGLL